MRYLVFDRGLGAGMLIAALAAVSTVHAASFDCAKATKPVEKVICTTPSLSQADETLAQDYRRLMEGLPPALKPILQKGQRSWLAYVPLYCSSDGRGTIGKPADFAQCVTQEYAQRVRSLQNQPARIGPFSVIQADEFQAMPSSSKEPDFFPIVSHTKSVAMVFGGEEQQAARVNEWLQMIATNEKANWNDPDTSASFTLTLMKANTVFASAVANTDIFGVGAAHPLSLSKMHHLFMKTGKPIQWRDVFQPDARAKLTQLAWTALKKKLGSDLMVEKPTGIAKLVEDPGHWQFGAQGLTIQFNVYEVAAYVMGPQEIMVPWSALKDSLSPTGLAIVEAAR